MTRTEIMAASVDRLDQLMAIEIMGWTFKGKTWRDKNGIYASRRYGFQPATRISQTVRAQDTFPKGTPRRWYARCLANLLKLTWKDRNDSIGLCVKYLYASPRDRCRAMLLAKLEKWDD